MGQNYSCSFRLEPVSYPHLLFFSGWTSGSKQEAAAEIFVSNAGVSLLQLRSITLLQLLHIQPALQLQTTHTHTHTHTHTNVTLEHKSSHKQHRYICSNSQQYIVVMYYVSHMRSNDYSTTKIFVDNFSLPIKSTNRFSATHKHKQVKHTSVLPGFIHLAEFCSRKHRKCCSSMRFRSRESRRNPRNSRGTFDQRSVALLPSAGAAAVLRSCWTTHEQRDPAASRALA